MNNMILCSVVSNLQNKFFNMFQHKTFQNVIWKKDVTSSTGKFDKINYQSQSEYKHHEEFWYSEFRGGC